MFLISSKLFFLLTFIQMTFLNKLSSNKKIIIKMQSFLFSYFLKLGWNYNLLGFTLNKSINIKDKNYFSQKLDDGWIALSKSILVNCLFKVADSNSMRKLKVVRSTNLLRVA